MNNVLGERSLLTSSSISSQTVEPRSRVTQPVAQESRRRAVPGRDSPSEFQQRQQGEVLSPLAGSGGGGRIDDPNQSITGELGPKDNGDGSPVNPEILANLDNYIQSHITATGEVTLREKQFPVFVDIVEPLKRAVRSGYVELPTGTGKTVIFEEFIKACMGRHRETTVATRETEETPEENKKPLRALVVVSGRQLVRQTEKEFHDHAPGIQVGKVYSDEEPDFNQEVTITTYDSLKLMNPEDYDVAVFDEAHKGLSDRRKELIGNFPNIRIGFTATPTYSDTKNVGLLFGERFAKMTVHEAIKSDLITGYRVLLGYSNVVDLSNVHVVRTNGEQEFNQVELAKAVNVAARNKSAVKLYEELFEGQSAIVTCVDIQHAEDAAKEFQESGKSAKAYHSKISRDEGIEILKSYERGETKVITIVSSLEQGWNSKIASVLFNLAPTESLVKAGQRGGRILRRKNDPEQIGVIVEFIDKNSNAVTYAQFAGGAYMPPPQRAEHIVGKRRPVKKPLPGESDTQTIKFQDLEVVTNVVQIEEYVQQSAARQRIEFLRLGASAISRITKDYDIPRGILLAGLNELPEEFADKIVYYGGSIYLLPEARDALVNLTSERVAPRAAEGWISINQNTVRQETLLFLQTMFPHQVGYFRSRAQGQAGYYAGPEIHTYLKQLPSPEEGVVSLPELPQGWFTQDQAISFIGQVMGVDVAPEDLVLLAEKYPDTAKFFKIYESQQSADVQKRTTVKMVGVRSDAEDQIRSVITEVKEERMQRRAEILGGVREGGWEQAKDGTWVHVTNKILHQYKRSTRYNLRTGRAWLSELKKKDKEGKYEIIDGELYVRRDFWDKFASHSFYG